MKKKYQKKCLGLNWKYHKEHEPVSTEEHTKHRETILQRLSHSNDRNYRRICLSYDCMPFFFIKNAFDEIDFLAKC